MMFNPPAVTVLRTKALLSKAACAKRSEITASYQSELEAGNRLNPSLDVIRRLSETLDAEPAAFYVPQAVIRAWVRANPGIVRQMLDGTDLEVVAS